jgi:hypothetical protein
LLPRPRTVSSAGKCLNKQSLLLELSRSERSLECRAACDVMSVPTTHGVPVCGRRTPSLDVGRVPYIHLQLARRRTCDDHRGAISVAVCSGRPDLNWISKRNLRAIEMTVTALRTRVMCGPRRTLDFCCDLLQSQAPRDADELN